MKQSPEIVEYLGAQPPADAPEWSEPDCYDLNRAGDRRQMYGREVIQLARKRGRAAEIADELFELNHPDQKDNASLREQFTASITAEGDRFGKWFYFPWSNQLVQYPDKEELQQILGFRNQYLITADEQRKIGAATIAHIGLSVGMKVLEESIHAGVGGKVILADHDRVSIANLNRLNVGMQEVGMRKTDVAGIKVSELNPYIRQEHFREGVTAQNVWRFIRHQPDLINEHVDHLPTKLLLRRTARQEKVPLVMATDIGDRSLIDIERYDTDDIQPFLGRLSEVELTQVEQGGLSPQEKMGLVVRIIGLENISQRMMTSLGQIGVTLGGIAQLGTTASVGGAYAAVAGREILLNRGPVSGRYTVSPQEIIGIPHL